MVDFMKYRFTGSEDRSINLAIANAFSAMRTKIQTDLNDAKTSMQTKINNNANLNETTKKAQRSIWQRKWGFLNMRFQGVLARIKDEGFPAIDVPWDWDTGNLSQKRDEDEDEGPSCKIQVTSTTATTFSTVVSKFRTEEEGYGALTGWHWHVTTENWGTGVAFNLPYTIKSGCVERAIVSAGGPRLECDSHPA
ncbi:hypothetical protein QQX98_002836 [Neonectria punicea]|uniref:Uncharacterized protein n=1 Tax=Neonectria punicea TaxID=979145 RepID=A0ABR1HGV2_9HYPO